MIEDTICAPATPPVNSPISIIRISGPETLRAARAVFSRPDNIENRKTVYGSIVDNGTAVDDVILVYYQGPGSYTGEDMCEIFTHGNPLIVRRIMSMLSALNIRLADHGEFSRRAFLNGKMDLTEAEAINQLITARSQWEISSAVDQMHGSMKQAIASIKDKAVLLKADIEAGIDFIQEDIEFVSTDEALKRTEEMRSEIEDVIFRCRLGEKISAGFNVAIAGQPNVGKSSLLNLMLNQERAIVSSVPGTTRDVIRELTRIEGLPINLYDTAGIAESDDEIEKIGISLSHRTIDDAALVIFVLDGSRELENNDLKILEEIADRKKIVVINKIDIAQPESAEKIETQLNLKCIRFSAKTAEGLRELESAIAAELKDGFSELNTTFAADARMIGLFENAEKNAYAVLELIRSNEPSEIIAAELQSLLSALGEITGEISPDEVLDSIFSRFCIGK